MTYQVTQQILDLVKNLFDQGYEGEAQLTNCYPSGAEAILGESLSVQLSGFCKESLYLVEDTNLDTILAVGRYGEEGHYGALNVSDVVYIAWRFYKEYKYQGYDIPHEFADLFKKYGYLKGETKTVLVEVD